MSGEETVDSPPAASPPRAPGPSCSVPSEGPAAPAELCLDPNKELFWEQLIIETLNIFGIPWLHFQKTMSIAKLKKSVVQSASKRLNCPAGGEHGVAMKGQYDANFNPGRMYTEEEGRVYLPDQVVVASDSPLDRMPLKAPIAPINDFYQGRFPGRKMT